MFPIATRRPGRQARVRQRPELGNPEALERRDLLAFTPMGFSIPDLTVTGSAAPIAAYGGQIQVALDVRNLGASSLIEPISLAPGAPSTADAPASKVEIFISRFSRFGPGAIPLAMVDIPPVLQNSKLEVDSLVSMPLVRLQGFPGSGGKVFLYFRIDPNNVIADFDRTNNMNRVGLPVQIEAPLPDLEAVALDVPPVMQPGDIIHPTIKVANFGTVNTAPQGPVTVALVASTDTNFGPGDTVLAVYTINDIPPLSDVATQATVLGDVNLDDTANIRTVTGPNVVLPTGPAKYFLGVIVDPLNTIREIREIAAPPSPALNPVRQVGPPIPFLPPAGVLSAPSAPQNVFPFPAFGPISTALNPTNIITEPPTPVVTATAIPLPAAFRTARRR